MDKKRNRADDGDIQPCCDEVRPPKHFKQERSEGEDTTSPEHGTMPEQLNQAVVNQGLIYRERLDAETARILVLHPGAESDEIKCDLRQKEPLVPASLITYEALSYVWGEKENPDSIVLCESPFAVTRNLAEALRYLRYSSSDRMLWVDAICINQYDEKERNHS